jgi:hypothetical protein
MIERHDGTPIVSEALKLLGPYTGLGNGKESGTVPQGLLLGHRHGTRWLA